MNEKYGDVHLHLDETAKVSKEVYKCVYLFVVDKTLIVLEKLHLVKLNWVNFKELELLILPADGTVPAGHVGGKW